MQKKSKRARPVAKKTGKKKSKSRALVQITSPAHSDIRVFVAQDLADESLIEQDLLGSVLPTMIYEYCPKRCKDLKTCEHVADRVRGLSIFGVRETVRRLNRNSASGHKIRPSERVAPSIEHGISIDGREGVQVTVYAEDLVSGGGSWGVDFVPYKNVGREGRVYDNQFATKIALSKAQRNAMRALIPEKAALAIIAKLIKEKSSVGPLPDIPTRQTQSEVTYGATLRRIQQISKDKVQLNVALENVGKLTTLNEQQMEYVVTTIKNHLKQLNKKV